MVYFQAEGFNGPLYMAVALLGHFNSAFLGFGFLSRHRHLRRPAAVFGGSTQDPPSTDRAGRGSDLEEWLSDAVINRDRNLRLQYFAGLGLNLYKSDEIYAEMLSHRKFPADLFVGPETKLESLRAVIQRGLLMP